MLSSTNGMKAEGWLIIQFGIDDGDRNCPRHVGTGAARIAEVVARALREQGIGLAWSLR